MTQKTDSSNVPKALIWPRPPDQPRFVFEVVLHSILDIVPPETEKDKLAREWLGKPDTRIKGPIFKKTASIVARNGSIYVSDTGTNSIVVIDVPRRKVYSFGARAPGTLGKPAGLALDGQMNVYVADTKRCQVLVYDSLGLFLRAIGSPKDLERPTGVAVSRDGKRIYVIDRSFNESNHHQVVVYDQNGEKIKVIGTRGVDKGQFNIPLLGATAPDGTLYILDSGNFRVQAFDSGGNFLRMFGGSGVGPGLFLRPRGIAVDDDGNIYVTDASFNNFQIFNPDGELLLVVGETAGAIQGQYSPLHGMVSSIAVDDTKRVYVLDHWYNNVDVFRRLSDSEGEEMLQEAEQAEGGSPGSAHDITSQKP